jgi:hypothetical protein
LQENGARRSAYRPPIGMPGGMLALSANGDKAGTGIVWAVVPFNGDANTQRGVQGIVLALDAEDVRRTLWTSEQNAEHDGLGLFAKFVPPVVADGKVFVATYGDDEPLRTYGGGSRPGQFPANYYVAVYGMMPEPKPTRPVVNQDRDDVTVVRADTAPLTLDTRACAPMQGASLDCTEALSKAAGRPSFHRVIVAAGQDTADCTVIHLTTAAKDSGLQNSTGIGFWSSRAIAGNQAAEDSGLFVPKDQLAPVGAATLKNGSPATLDEFVGVTNCGGIQQTTRLFKPYMQFENAQDGRIYRNWDVESNYSIGPEAPRIDRTADVLR